MNASSPSLSVREQLAGKHILVTGVTGFLGKVWVLMMLEHLPEIGRMTVLVRGRRGESAVDRLERELGISPALRPLRRRHGANSGAVLAERVDVLDGDIAQHRCGLDDHDLAALQGVDLVLHFAGLTDFQPDPLLALAINTHGANHVADVAAALGVPMIHVSTAYVAGRTSGRIPESLDPGVSPLGVPFDAAAELAALDADLAKMPSGRADRQLRIDTAMARASRLGWPNIYTFSKALGERILHQRTDVHVTTVRPTIVECARRFPFEGWNEGVNTSAPLAWLISTAFRDFPSRAHHHFDIVPVDLVARGCTLVAADVLRGGGGGVFHLGTSGSNPVSYGRIIELTGLANRRRLAKADGASAFERLVVPHLDPVAVDADKRPLWHVTRVRKGARSLQKWLRKADVAELPEALRDVAGDRLEDLRKRGIRRANEALRTLGRIETMLELFQPFVHDQDYIFENGRIRALSTGLPDDEQADFAFDADTIDWRHYWYDVQYPGLWLWSIPILEGERAPTDAPISPPLSLRSATARQLGTVDAK